MKFLPFPCAERGGLGVLRSGGDGVQSSNDAVDYSRKLRWRVLRELSGNSLHNQSQLLSTCACLRSGCYGSSLGLADFSENRVVERGDSGEKRIHEGLCCGCYRDGPGKELLETVAYIL